MRHWLEGDDDSGMIWSLFAGKWSDHVFLQEEYHLFAQKYDISCEGNPTQDRGSW